VGGGTGRTNVSRETIGGCDSAPFLFWHFSFGVFGGVAQRGPVS